MANMLNENFKLLKQLFNDCLNAKNNVDEKKIDLDEKLKIGSLEFVLIKKINRLVKYKVRSGREELQSKKTLVDSNRLHLQNLLYEVNYLRREIKHCYKFKSQDEDIDIYEQTEDTIPEHLMTHKDRIERLERELSLRKKLSEDCSKLLNDKNTIFNQILIKMENLHTFAPSLRTLLKATRPLQEALQMPIEQKWKLEHKVHMLPQSLYIAYVNIKAIEQLESGFDLVVFGQEEELKAYDVKRNQLDVVQEHNFVLQLQPHPFSLQIKFHDTTHSNDYVIVKIYYIPLLDILTAQCEIRLVENQINQLDCNVLDDFLKFIGENDFGNSLPFSSASLNLQKHNITLEEFQNFLENHNLGKPYKWLQYLSGSSSFNDIKNNHNKIIKIKDFTTECVRKIKGYWYSRINLITQIRAFVNKNLEGYIDKSVDSMKPNCALVQWSAISWDEYEASNTTIQLNNQQLVDETGSFFRAVIVLGSAKMECLIGISNKYPLNTPLWTVTVYWNGHHNALNNASIKAMELYTNSLKDIKSSNLLSTQLLRTMYSFDIFLETEGPLYHPLEYSKEKSFIKSYSKRMRIRPYKKITKGSINYFKQ